MIVVGGEALVDLVEDGDFLRPVPGGGPFNTAVALGRLDMAVAFLGTLSTDSYGDALAALLCEANVDTSLVRRSSAPTPLAIVRRTNGANAYTFYLVGTSLSDPPDVAALRPGAEVVHVGTLALAVEPPASAYEALVGGTPMRAVILDPNVRPEVFGGQREYRERFERLARLATVVKMSDGDAAWIYPELATEAAAEHVLALGPRLVAVTLGERGAFAVSAAGRVRVAAVPVEVEDTVGAGDSFGAALLAALVEENALSPETALEDDLLERALGFAATAAAITCTRVGAVPPTRAEVDAWLVEPLAR